MNKKYLALSIKILISVAFVIWIILKVNWSEVLFYMEKLSLWQIIIFSILFIVGTIISAYKWGLLAKHKDINRSLWEYFKIYLTGAFINNFTPSFIGGDAYRSYQTGKGEPNRYPEAASAVAMDRITGFLGTIILIFLFSLLNLKLVLKTPALIITDILLIASFGIDITLMLIRKTVFWRMIKKYSPEYLIKFIRETGSYNSDRSIITKTVFWGIVFNFVGVGLANYILFIAFNIKIGLLDYFTVTFIISIISAIPISINNIGVREWAHITFFGLFGIDSAAVVSVAIVSRILMMLITFLALPMYIRDKKILSAITAKDELETASK